MKVLFSLSMFFSPLFSFAAGNAIQDAAAIDAQLNSMVGAAVVCGISTTQLGGLKEASQNLNSVLTALKTQVTVSVPIIQSSNVDDYRLTSICVTLNRN